MHKAFFFLFFFLVPFFTLAQQVSLSPAGSAKISGSVLDATTKQAVDFATVAIFVAGNKTPLSGQTTDAAGQFKFENLAEGDYTLQIDFLGYERLTVAAHIQAAGQTRSLGKLLLNSAQHKLAEVTVTASAATVVNKIDKLVYSPANDLTSQGGVALDVLKKVPQVTVDIDGNVELQGNANIRFLINGKPSSIFGASLADALQSIPASQIKSIEVMTVPGAKYDAQGTGGVINIVLKDNKVEGINGSINLSAGTRLENGAFNLNARKGRLSANLFFSGNVQLNSISKIAINRNSTNIARDTLSSLMQDGHYAFVRGGYEGGLNLVYAITPKDELTGSLGIDQFSNQNTGFTAQEQNFIIRGTNGAKILSDRLSESKFHNNSMDMSLGYKKTFKKEDEELDFLYSSYTGRDLNSSRQQQLFTQPMTLQTGTRTVNPGNDRETDVSLDYTLPVSKSFTLETGAKVVLEKISNAVRTDTLLSDGGYGANAGQSNGFSYNRKIFAGYGAATVSLFHKFLDLKSGLRYEYTVTDANFAGPKVRPGSVYAPTLVLSHKLNAQELIKLSYTYRIERPGYNDLNPFYNISDPHNVTTGNPELRPEIGHNYELGFNKTFEKGSSVYVAAIYRHNTNDIQQFTYVYPSKVFNGVTYTNVSLTERYNLGSEISAGVNVYGSVQVTQAINLRSNMFFVDRISSNPGSPQVSGPAYRINLNGSYNFDHDLAAEFFINYRSSQRTIQGRNGAFAFYNVAVRKQFMHKKASIGLTAANPFNEYVQTRPYTYGPGFTQTTTRKLPFRSFGISFSYKFGKLEFKGGKDKDEVSPPAPAEN